MKQLQQKNNETWSDEDIVFHPADKPYHLPKSVSRYMYAALKKLKLTPKKRLSLHSTRHTVATKLVNANVPIPSIQAIGGWASPDTILHNYAHQDEEITAKAMALLY